MPLYAFPSSLEPHIKSLNGLWGVLALLGLFHHLLLTQPDSAACEWHSMTTRPHNLFESAMFSTPLRVLWSGHERAILFFFVLIRPASSPWRSFASSRRMSSATQWKRPRSGSNWPCPSKLSQNHHVWIEPLC